jgi:hypothetical protein
MQFDAHAADEVPSGSRSAQYSSRSFGPYLRRLLVNAAPARSPRQRRLHPLAPPGWKAVPQRHKRVHGERGAVPLRATLRSTQGQCSTPAFAPGLQEQRFDSPVADAAKFIPAGSDLVFQLHYTTNGKPASDQTRVGLTLAAQPPKYRYFTTNATQQGIAIPPNDPNYESHSMVTINAPAQLVWLMPHMHVRGKDFLYKAAYPTGETETLLSVPNTISTGRSAMRRPSRFRCRRARASSARRIMTTRPTMRPIPTRTAASLNTRRLFQ